MVFKLYLDSTLIGFDSGLNEWTFSTYPSVKLCPQDIIHLRSSKPGFTDVLRRPGNFSRELDSIQS